MNTTARVTLIWVHSGKIETESVVWYDGARRAKQLQGCMATKVYRFSPILSTLQLYTGIYWMTVEDAPEEIKLATMLLT